MYSFNTEKHPLLSFVLVQGMLNILDRDRRATKQEERITRGQCLFGFMIIFDELIYTVFYIH